MALYQVRNDTHGVLRVVKFSLDYDVLKIYYVYRLTKWKCTCPLGERDVCKHRAMREIFSREDKIDTGWFYNFDDGLWLPPISYIRIKKAMEEF